MNDRLAHAKARTAVKAVVQATYKRARAEDEQREAIREAWNAGVSLRRIADVADLSHETVRRICAPNPEE